MKLHKDKKLYKRQSESLEEASMSGMQQMLNQQIEYEKIRVALQEKREAEAAAIAAAAAAAASSSSSNVTTSTPNSSAPMSERSTGSNSIDNSTIGADSKSSSSVEKK